MKPSIALEVTHADRKPGPIEGFTFMWAYYVNGFDATTHCQSCFKGKLVDAFKTTTASTGHAVVLDEIEYFKYVYVCGVAAGPATERGRKNFHFPLMYQENASVAKTTYNGYIVTAQHAVELRSPPLPDGWNGRDLETTRCKNFQFAVEYFGYPASMVMAEHR